MAEPSQNGIDLAAYMSGSIRNIMATAYRNVLSNPREAKFAFKMQTLFQKSEKRRRKVKEREGFDVPPFLISSISSTCNLHCKGCYARSNGIAEDEDTNRKATLTPQQWQQIFTEAAEMGINFLRRHLNMVPIISIEGTGMGTDERRGQGVFRRAMQSMELLRQEDLFFGTSITVTTENLDLVTSSAFIDTLRSYGCKIVFFIEYVPTEPGTEHLAFGRGFFHIGPDGSAEPCPFSPFSDSNVVELGLRGALQSPLFRKIRAAKALGWEHTGGCTLFEHREEVEGMVMSNG